MNDDYYKLKGYVSVQPKEYQEAVETTITAIRSAMKEANSKVAESGFIAVALVGLEITDE